MSLASRREQQVNFPAIIKGYAFVRLCYLEHDVSVVLTSQVQHVGGLQVLRGPCPKTRRASAWERATWLPLAFRSWCVVIPIRWALQRTNCFRARRLIQNPAQRRQRRRPWPEVVNDGRLTT